MKITIGNGEEHEVDPEVLDYLTLHYGNLLIEKYNTMDMAAQTGIKFLVKTWILKPFLKTFGLDAKLPRGTDPNLYMIRAYIVLMRESLNRGNLKLITDGAGVIVDSTMTYSGMEDDFSPLMAGYLEELKHAGRGNEERLLAAKPDQGRTGPELAISGQEAQWEDNGGETYRLQSLSPIS